MFPMNLRVDALLELLELLDGGTTTWPPIAKSSA